MSEKRFQNRTDAFPEPMTFGRPWSDSLRFSSDGNFK